jgi:hypothetical protein
MMEAAEIAAVRGSMPQQQRLPSFYLRARP